MKDYSFYIAVYSNGRQIPVVNFHDYSLHELNGFAKEVLSNFDLLNPVLFGLKQVLDGKLDEFSFGEDEMHNFTSKIKETEVYSSFDSYTPFRIDTKLIYNVLLDWKEFILQWKENKIPCLKYPN